MLEQDDVRLAHCLADAAGAAILPHFRRLDRLDVKADASPVTVADRAAETALRDLIARERPEDGILGEEFAPVAGRSDRVWVFDPIDGTKAFAAGKPTFTTLIALAVDGRPVLGVIDQPYLRERWLGVDGTANFNGRPLRAQRARPLHAAILSSTAPEQFAADAERGAFDRLSERVAYVTWGGDAYAYGLLALGTVDLVVEAGLKAYDLAALAPILEGAGAIVSDWRGEPLHLDSDGRVVAAADPGLHADVLALLAG